MYIFIHVCVSLYIYTHFQTIIFQNIYIVLILVALKLFYDNIFFKILI